MNQKLIINGGKLLKGNLPIFGAKNACLPIICSSLLANEKVTLNNIPDLKDIYILQQLLTQLGSTVEFNKEKRQLTIINSPDVKSEIDDLATQMRASILLIAPMLAKTGYAKIPFPGGCGIGNRPIDITLDGLRALGVEFTPDEDFLIAELPKDENDNYSFKAGNFRLRMASVGASEMIIMAASVADGTSIIENIAQEPEVEDTVNFLNKLGANIEYTKNNEVKITGNKNLKGATHNIIPDRIITGTYAVMAALCADKEGITIENCIPAHLKTELNVLKASGVKMEIKENSIFIPQQDKSSFKGVDFETDVYPGFATDLQAPFTTFMTQAKNEPHITENIYENRLMHVEHLNNMNADIRKISNHIAAIHGPSELIGTSVESTDLRASAALVIAGLIAKGTTTIHKVEHLQRGYENIELFLTNIGADIKLVQE